MKQMTSIQILIFESICLFILAIITYFITEYIIRKIEERRDVSSKVYLPSGSVLRYESHTIISMSKSQQHDDCNGNLISVEIIKSRNSKCNTPIDMVFNPNTNTMSYPNNIIEEKIK